MPSYGDKIEARVSIRRGDNWNVRPGAEQLEGKVHTFSFGWEITADDRSEYAGEIAWISDRDGWPDDAPVWIASGDLQILREL